MDPPSAHLLIPIGPPCVLHFFNPDVILVPTFPDAPAVRFNSRTGTVPISINPWLGGYVLQVYACTPPRRTGYIPTPHLPRLEGMCLKVSVFNVTQNIMFF